jgi:ABC-type branched-subunit amino acid transport system substrate-binding protein/outer membrane protein assembly factor BamD (BamD/ComL family)
MLRCSLVSLLIFISSSQLFGQLTDQQIFLKGVEAYKRGNYTDSRKFFFTALKDYPNSRLQTSIKLMLAKSYDKLGDYSAANLVIDDFLLKYDQSNYLDDIHFLRGNIFYKKKDYTAAVEEWLWVVYNSRDSRLKNKAGDHTFRTMESYLTDSEISQLKQKYPDDIFMGLIEVVQAKKLINSGDREKGEYRLERFLDNYPYHFYADQVSQMLRNRRGSGITSNNILILKTGDEEGKQISDALAKGFMYAAYEMSQREMNKSLVIDTLSVESNVLSMLHSTMGYIDRKNPLAVIGPLNDDGNTAMALLSRYEYFPFISPLSSQKGLASLSAYGFQINPDAEIKGRFMAEYAINELELRTFATLAPADAYGISLVKGFEDVLLEHEMDLVEKQWYYSDTEDFSRQFKTIRKQGFYITFRDSIESTIDTVMTEEEMQEQFQQYLTETLFSNEGRREIDSTQVASSGIDALFIATYPEYIPFIAPQFAFQNIQTQLLGNEGWNDKETLLQQRVYLEGLIYLSAGFFDPESWNYKAFQSRFRQKMQDTPGVYHLLGYDIGKWMISHYQPGLNRGTYREHLANSPMYEGILENIHFGIKPRVNSQLNIIKFYRGQILKVK